jgi:hypothetical protein
MNIFGRRRLPQCSRPIAPAFTFIEGGGMKRALLVVPMVALAFASLVISQDKPGAAMGGRDSMQQMMPSPGQDGKAMMGRDGMGGMKERMMAGQQCYAGGMMPGAWCSMQDHRFMMQGRFMARHPRAMKLCIAFLFLVIALVNILLTILVCMDMAKLGTFTPMWIPIILLFGIPGTALYALFRIGDMIKAAGK